MFNIPAFQKDVLQHRLYHLTVNCTLFHPPLIYGLMQEPLEMATMT